MGSEVLLYGYGMVCLSMLVFNVAYNIIMKHSDLRLGKRSRRLGEQISLQLDRLRRGEKADPGHIRYLRRRLSRINGLIAFADATEQYLMDEDDPAVEAYCQQLQPVILYLAVVYLKRDDMQAAYFAYVLSKYKRKRHLPMDGVQDILVEYMRKDSLYCRVNALEALYCFGSVESVVKAVMVLDGEGSFIHEKVLTDGLLSYTGDHAELVKLLWKDFDRFSQKTQLSILNYIRFQTGDCCGEIFGILEDGERGKELRLSAIRYFGRYHYEPARDVLLTLAAERDPQRWEYTAVSVSALAAYPGEDTAAVLMDAMHSGNWYVRYNAAESLEAFHLDYRDLLGVVGSRDRYAREMLMYRLDARQEKEKNGGGKG